MGVTLAVSARSRAPTNSRMLERLIWYTGSSAAVSSRRARAAMLSICSRVRAMGVRLVRGARDAKNERKIIHVALLNVLSVARLPATFGASSPTFRSLHAQTSAWLFFQRSFDRPGHG